MKRIVGITAVLMFACSGQNSPQAPAAQSAPEPAKPDIKPLPTPRTLSSMDDAKANKSLEFNHDDMAQVTWFHAKNYERTWKKFNQWSSVALYFGWFGKTSSFGPLRLKATSHGQDWTFARRLVVKVDDGEPFSLSIYDYRKSSVSNGVWENYDVPLVERDRQCFDPNFSLYEKDVCKKIRDSFESDPNRLDSFCSPRMLAAKKVRVRFDGDRANTFDLPRNQLDDIKAVCGAYLALAR